MVNLITTDSYFNLFPVLTQKLALSARELDKKQAVFCEAKVSLMVERYLCAATGGSFNTDVYSFGKFLRENKAIDKVLSKEGSAMVIKRILGEIRLLCFKQSKANLAPTLYDLIIQLKSAKVTPQDLLVATDSVGGVLKNKLGDIYAVYSEYERFVKENGYEDQSSLLSYLPDVIYSSQDIKSTDVYLVGYGSFTAQMRAAVSALIDCAKSVTAILVEGDNPHVYVNETARFIREECRAKGVPILESRVNAEYAEEGKIIIDNLFSPVLRLPRERLSKYDRTDSGKLSRYPTDKVYFHRAVNPADEVARVGEIIRQAVKNGECRYRDITIALPDAEFYKENIRSAFSSLGIPYFLDERQAPASHPLVTLILAYIDVFRKGFERETLSAVFKNPLFTADKDLSDRFENYLIKYNINYRRIFNPFTYPADGVELEKLENMRIRLCGCLREFNVKKTLEYLNAEDSLKELSLTLKSAGESEQAAVTEQIYAAVCGLLEEMQAMLKGTELSYTEFKNVFSSGISALKLSVIPQYNDAVFIGGYKECALARAEYLFAVGLTGEVPSVQADVALLSDGDINALEQIKVLVEPKIRVVNHRTRERVGMALSAFNKRLYLSYPMATVDGKKNIKSEVMSGIEKLFDLQSFPEVNGYLTYAQGVNTFAKACGEFSEGRTDGDFNYDFTLPSSFYHAVGAERLKPLVDGANKELVEKVRLDGENVSLVGKVTSPTAIEDYYRCPFSAFASHALKIKDRDEGKVSALSVGTLMHEILNGYVRALKTVTDKESSDALFDSLVEKILQGDEYARYLKDPSTRATVNRVLKECKKYCYEKTYKNVSATQFTSFKTEAAFGDGEKAEYPAIPLMGGKVKLKGKIDRVDENEKYFRVLDYKTGKTDPSEKALFAGVKLQLYLYAAAVREKYKNDGGKFPAGLYYLPVSDKFRKTDDEPVDFVGKTLSDRDALCNQGLNPDEKVKDGVDRQTLEQYMDYAVKACDLAVKRLSEGVIKPSPYESACEYCQYSALCGKFGAVPRSVGSVKDAFNTVEQGGEE